VHKFLLKIVFSLAFKGPQEFLRRLEDLTPGALCPPTLGLPEGVKKMIFSRHPGENRGPGSA